MMSPPDLVGKPFRNDEWAIMDIRNLERMRASRTAQDSQEVNILLRPSRIGDRLLARRAPPSVRAAASDNSGSEDTAALHDEIKRLKSSLETAVKTNEKMWNGIVDLKMSS